MDLDWCIRCDKRTQGDDLYCSDTCRLDDQQATSPVGVEQDLVNGLFGLTGALTGTNNIVSPSSSPSYLGHQPTKPLSSAQQYPVIGQAHNRVLAGVPLRLPTPVMMRAVLPAQRRHPIPPLQPPSLERQPTHPTFSLTNLGMTSGDNHPYPANTHEFNSMLSSSQILNARPTTDVLPVAET